MNHTTTSHDIPDQPKLVFGWSKWDNYECSHALHGPHARELVGFARWLIEQLDPAPIVRESEQWQKFEALYTTPEGAEEVITFEGYCAYTIYKQLLDQYLCFATMPPDVPVAELVTTAGGEPDYERDGFF